MFKSVLRWLWPSAVFAAMTVPGCYGPPDTDATDPLPKVFGNKDLDPSFFGPGSGMGGGGGGGGMGMGGGGGGGGMGMGGGGGGGGSRRHGKGGAQGLGGGNQDGTGGGQMKAKAQKASPDSSPGSEKPEKKDGTEREQP